MIMKKVCILIKHDTKSSPPDIQYKPLTDHKTAGMKKMLWPKRFML